MFSSLTALTAGLSSIISGVFGFYVRMQEHKQAVIRLEIEHKHEIERLSLETENQIKLTSIKLEKRQIDENIASFDESVARMKTLYAPYYGNNNGGGNKWINCVNGITSLVRPVSTLALCASFIVFSFNNFMLPNVTDTFMIISSDVFAFWFGVRGGKIR